MKYIGTMKATYLCTEVSETENGYHLKNALEITNRNAGAALVAKAYLDNEL